MSSDNTLVLRLRKDLVPKQSCGIDYLYVPAYHPNGRPKQGKIVVLNETGLFLWNQLQALDSFTLPQAIDLLRKEYDIDEPQARADVKALLNEWYISFLLDK